MNLKSTLSLAAAAALTALTAGCASTTAPASADSDVAVYAGTLQAMNTGVTGAATTGKVRLVVKGDTLTAHIFAKNTPPQIIHWQHFHGFKDGSEASCPTPLSDTNGDGIVDLIETHPTSGKTMVPFIRDPASMNIAHGTYPVADAQGDYHYQESVPLEQLETVFENKFGGNLDLGSRVVFIHGVPANTDLPASVASLGPIPAQVTLPIACAALTRVK